MAGLGEIFRQYQNNSIALYGLGVETEKALRDGAFEKSKNAAGEYRCACCGLTSSSRVFFQVDHVVPMNKGGKSVPENLQILCRKCNGIKGDS